MDVAIGTIEITRLRELRPALLAPPSGEYDADYPGDFAADTLHVAIRSGTAVVGFATALREPCPAEASAEDWRIRGLAVAPEARRQGIASQLIAACGTHATAHGAERVWAWARPTSQGRFLAAGFQLAEGQGRDFAGIGPHELLIRRWSASVAARRPRP